MPMGVVSRLGKIRESVKGLVKKKPEEEVRFDEQKGKVVLATKDARIKMELFKIYPKRKSWGFELVIENRSGKEMKDAVVWFTHSRHASLDKLPAEKIAIRTLEFGIEELPIGPMEIKFERAIGGERKSSLFQLDVKEVREKFSKLGKFDEIEEEEKDPSLPSEVGTEVRLWRNEPTVKVEIKPPKPAAQTASQASAATAATAKQESVDRLAQISREKDDVMAQFMKRKIDYATYQQLLNALQKEELDLKAKTGTASSSAK